MAKTATVPPTTPSPAAAAVPAKAVDLDVMGTDDLLKHAEANNLDVGNSVRRSTLVTAIKAGRTKPPAPSSPGPAPAKVRTDAEKAELAAIDRELAELGNPRAVLEAFAEKLRGLRASRTATLKDLDKAIGGMESEFRPLQRKTANAMDRVAALKARRAKLA